MNGAKAFLSSCSSIRRKPENLVDADVQHFAREFVRDSAPGAIVHLDGVDVNSRGDVCRGGRWADFSCGRVRWCIRGRVRAAAKMYLRDRKVTSDAETPAILCFDRHWCNYFHWITEALPRLHCVEDQLPFSTVLLPGRAGRLQRDTLAIYGCQDLRAIEEGTYHRVDRLVVPVLGAISGNYHAPLMSKVRERLLANAPAQGLSLGKRIYVSRRNAQRRRLKNEKEVVDVLAARGFTEVCFENYAVWEQVSIAQAATHMIGLHGAGLTNMLFMDERSSVLEFRHGGDLTNLCYFALASECGHRYYYQFGKPDRGSGSTWDADVDIDCRLLQNTLNRFLGAD